MLVKGVDPAGVRGGDQAAELGLAGQRSDGLAEIRALQPKRLLHAAAPEIGVGVVQGASDLAPEPVGVGDMGDRVHRRQMVEPGGRRRREDFRAPQIDP